jgi:hypothetical protein
MREVAKLVLRSYVVFLGLRDDVPELICAMDAGAMASHEEWFANAQLEKLAAGLPVVVTNVGGNPRPPLWQRCPTVSASHTQSECTRRRPHPREADTRSILDDAGAPSALHQRTLVRDGHDSIERTFPPGALLQSVWAMSPRSRMLLGGGFGKPKSCDRLHAYQATGMNFP